MASDLNVRLEQARTEMDSDSYRSAKKILDAAEKSVPQMSEAVSNEELARLFFDRGVLERLRGDTRGRTMAAWRRTLIIDPDFEWDSRYLGEGDDWSLFEALRSEVGSYPMVDLSIPEQQGAAILYADGQVVRAGDSVIQGVHLAQIRCDDGVVRGVWTEFQSQFDWFGLCPGGVDTTVELTESSGDGDEWSEFGPVFGAPVTTAPVVQDDTAEPVTSPVEEASTEEVVDSVAISDEGPSESPEEEASTDEAVASVVISDKEPEAVVSAEEAVSEEPKIVEDAADSLQEAASDGMEPVSLSRDSWMRSLPVDSKQILSGGGALLVTGMVVNFTVVNSTWAEIDAARNSPHTVSRDEADALTLRFNRGRTAVFVLGGSGMALLGLGGAAWLQEQGSLRLGSVVLQPQITPTRAGVHVAF